MQRRAPLHHGMRAALPLSHIAAHDGFRSTPDCAECLLAAGKQATSLPGVSSRQPSFTARVLRSVGEVDGLDSCQRNTYKR